MLSIAGVLNSSRPPVSRVPSWDIVEYDLDIMGQWDIQPTSTNIDTWVCLKMEDTQAMSQLVYQKVQTSE